ncbi:hypothetical protein RHMOL_Rhmol03G0139200 [Rhododendron molle]|uniref:Uncharacterized protein n=1 Tax=Rhododendron molle TaxID=49168 RepID=A0ACC0PFC0_RHOML|nr:hypothetical protein RHMOL_Rhmol03G0139200 [Rhododendron molle]
MYQTRGLLIVAKGQPQCSSFGKSTRTNRPNHSRPLQPFGEELLGTRDVEEAEDSGQSSGDHSILGDSDVALGLLNAIALPKDMRQVPSQASDALRELSQYVLLETKARMKHGRVLSIPGFGFANQGMNGDTEGSVDS